MHAIVMATIIIIIIYYHSLRGRRMIAFDYEGNHYFISIIHYSLSERMMIACSLMMATILVVVLMMWTEW